MQNKANQIEEPIRGSTAILVVRLALVVIILEGVYSLLFYFLNLQFNLPFEWHHHLSLGFLLIQLLKIGFEIYLVLLVVLSWLGTIYYLTDKNLIKKQGILSSKEEIYDFDNSHSVILNQSFLGRLFNYGDILISAEESGENSQQMSLYGINDPKKYEHLLRKCINQAKDNYGK